MQDQYRRSEDEYFKLRGQFDTGRVTQEQFDDKLRELMVQDSQGRYWMLGADSGKWYIYDGSKWVQGDPYAGVAGAAVAATAAPPLPETGAAVAPTVTRDGMAPPPATASGSARGGPLVPILLILLALLLGAVVFLLFQNRDRIFVAQSPQQITPDLPPTITRAPSPTPLGVQSTAAAVGTAVLATIPPLPTTAPPTDLPTQFPITEAPQVLPTLEPATTVVVVTPIPTLTVLAPTLLPTVTIAPTLPPTAQPTLPPTAEPTVPPAPTNTPLPNVPPDVYVTAIDVSPFPAKKNQEATFSATFLNTTGGPRAFTLQVLTYDPNKPGPNKQFGESTPVDRTIPPGESVQTFPHIAATGPGGCIPLYARMAYRVSQFDKPLFSNVVPDLATVYFDVCPP